MLPDPLFTLFPGSLDLKVYMYGLMISLGILVCFCVIFIYGKRLGITQKLSDFLFYTGIASIIVSLGSAAFFEALYEYIENPEGGFNLDTGLTFIGGLIGGVLTFVVAYIFYHKKLDQSITEALPLVVCCVSVAHAFGRLGCFFAGCCYGKPTDGIFGVKFPRLPAPVHPAQLYESIFLFALFAVLSVMALKFKSKQTVSVYLIGYGIFRFLIEYIRDDERGAFIPGVTPSQFWSIVMIIIGVALIFVFKKIGRSKPEEQEGPAPEITE